MYYDELNFSEYVMELGWSLSQNWNRWEHLNKFNGSVVYSGARFLNVQL